MPAELCVRVVWGFFSPSLSSKPKVIAYSFSSRQKLF